MTKIAPAPTAEEIALRNENRDIYNSGNMVGALEHAKEFYRTHPDSVYAQYAYAVMHGDYSASQGLAEAEKQRCLDIAKVGIAKLFARDDLSAYPPQFLKSIKNEYYWFFEKHIEQYELGVQELAKGSQGGDYSACVGAAMQALKELRSGHQGEAERWATASLQHFTAFERHSPDWYNINYFAAWALAVLGREPEAKTTFIDMFRKQKAAAINQAEYDGFLLLLDEVRGLRAPA